MLQTNLPYRLQRRSPRNLMLKWTLATAIAGAIVGALESGGWQFLATLILSGLFVGIGQWFVIRRHIPRSSRWVIASTIGWIIGTYIQIGSDPLSAPLIDFLTLLGGWEVLWMNGINQAITAIVFGLAQWLVLRRSIAQAQGWVLASVVAGAIAGLVGAAVCRIACQPIMGLAGASIAGAIATGSAWAAYGGITGWMLNRLLRSK